MTRLNLAGFHQVVFEKNIQNQKLFQTILQICHI